MDRRNVCFFTMDVSGIFRDLCDHQDLVEWNTMLFDHIILKFTIQMAIIDRENKWYFFCSKWC